MIETTALGAGLLAGLATGFWASHRDLDRARRIERTFQPRAARAWRQRRVRRAGGDAVKTLLATKPRG